MSFRNLTQQHPAIIAVIAILIIVGCVIWTTRGNDGVTPSQQIYFYDLGSGELFTADRAQEPPVDAPSGAALGVKAAVFSCGACTDDDFVIAFISTYSEPAREALQQRGQAGEEDFDVQRDAIIEQGMLVAALPEDGEQPRWVPAMTPQGIAIASRTDKLCGDAPAKPCLPH
jgi:hypothetical protein